LTVIVLYLYVKEIQRTAELNILKALSISDKIHARGWKENRR